MDNRKNASGKKTGLKIRQGTQLGEMTCVAATPCSKPEASLPPQTTPHGAASASSASQESDNNTEVSRGPKGPCKGQQQHPEHEHTHSNHHTGQLHTTKTPDAGLKGSRHECDRINTQSERTRGQTQTHTNPNVKTPPQFGRVRPGTWQPAHRRQPERQLCWL